jgi:hypothetical protein
MTIKAIETRYAGCRFRSRLEARWAVFFDALGIAWEYEPQGFECEYRITRESGSFTYLPDFWLPELKVWAEVKGSLDRAALRKVLNAAAYLSNSGGGCAAGQEGAYDTVLLGPVPDPSRRGRVLLPNRLHMHKGDLVAAPWNWDKAEVCVGANNTPVANDSGSSWADQDKLAAFLLEGQTWEQ